MSSAFPIQHFSINVEESEEKRKVKPNKPETKRYEWLGQRNQSYEGFSLYDNLHGSGNYFIDDGYSIYYDGLFYANKLEGYCQIFYSESGTHFQGLFRDNRRFGPGVLTYSDGRQDVGLWDGYSLIRTGEAHHSLMTSLANTNTGYLKLLKFRKWVDVSSKDEDDVAKKLLLYFGATDSVLKKSNDLYNVNIKNRNNLFFPKPVYDEYYAKTSYMIDILRDGSDYNLLTGPKNEEDEQEVEMIRNKIDLFDNRLEELEKLLINFKKDKDRVQQKIDFCNKCCSVVDRSKHSTLNATDDQSVCKVDFVVSESSINLGSLSFISFTDEKKCDDVGSDMNRKDEDELSSYLDKCTCMDEMEIEDLAALENELNYLFNKYAFYSIIVNQMSEKRKRLSDQLELREKFHSMKVNPNNVLAWNNELTLMEMMKHSFLFRKTEYMVNFKVADILSGLRGVFYSPGDVEIACAQFFTACSAGDNNSLIHYLRKPYFNVNVSDAVGNTGIFFASVRNRWDTIRVLAEFGANTNQFNDECLTPLSLSIICYLIEKYHVDNYEEVFIPKTVISDEDVEKVESWYPSRSLLEIVNTRSSVRFTSTKKPKVANKFTSEADMAKNSCYIFSTKYPNFTLDPVDDSSTESIIKIIDSESLPNTLKEIEETIKTLLDYGAKPYIGICPIPAFLMTLYTENVNIVRLFLDHSANVNVVTHIDQLNALHIMASARCNEMNLQICQILLKYDCNPNAKAHFDHWREVKEKLLTFVGSDFYEDIGKNPLHTLCLRVDFRSDNCRYFETIAKELIEAGIDVEATYLGQDALRLAMISGNVNLVQFLIDLDVIDPYRVNKNEGNILTFFLTNRFINILPLDNIKKVIEKVIDNNVSPLNALDDYDNVADFINNIIITKAHTVTQGKQKPRMSLSYSPSQLKVIKKNSLVIKKLADFLSVLTRRKILERLALVLTEVLFEFAREKLLDNPAIKPIALYVSPQSFLTNLEILFNHGKIHEERFEIGLVQDVINFLLQNCQLSPVKSKKRVKTQQSKDDKYATSSHDFLNSIEHMNFKKIHIVNKKYNLLPPGLDVPERYKVCIECFKTVTEFVCPICQQIYFCSKRCFQNHLKRKSDKHLCQVIMFDDSTESQGITGLMDMYNLFHESCEPNYILKNLAKHETEQNRCKEEHNKDPYSIKPLRTVKSSSLHEGTVTDTQITTSTTVNKKQLFLATSADKINNHKKIVEKQNAAPIQGKTSKSKLNPENQRRKFKRDDSTDDVDEFHNDGKNDRAKHRDKRKLGNESRKRIQKDDSTDDYNEFNNDGKRDRAKHRDKGNLGNENRKRIKKVEENSIGVHVGERNFINESNQTKMGGKAGNDSKLFDGKDIPLETAALDTKVPDHMIGLEHLPSKPIYFMEIMSKLLPDVDLHNILFPYICYVDGHLYYTFKDSPFYCKNFSMN